MKRLNIGCGRDIKKGYVNLDFVKQPGIDIVHDLSKFPWPFKDNEFDEIIAIHIIEHLEDLINTIKELSRIAKKGGIIKIQVPHFSSWANYADPTHKKIFSYSTFNYFTKTNFYQKRDEEGMIKIIKRRINFFPKHLKQGKLNFLFDPFLNSMPKIYERLFYGILPAAELYFELKILK